MAQQINKPLWFHISQPSGWSDLRLFAHAPGLPIISTSSRSFTPPCCTMSRTETGRNTNHKKVVDRGRIKGWSSRYVYNFRPLSNDQEITTVPTGAKFYLSPDASRRGGSPNTRRMILRCPFPTCSEVFLSHRILHRHTYLLQYVIDSLLFTEG